MGLYEGADLVLRYTFSSFWLIGIEDVAFLRAAFSSRLGCFAHGMQLVISSMFKQQISQSHAYKNMCSLMGQFKKSHVATEVISSCIL